MVVLLSYSVNLLMVFVILFAFKKLGFKFIYHRITLLIYGGLGDHYWRSKVSQFELLQKPMETVFIGDSLTDGFLLHEYFEKGVVNRGINGESTTTLLKRLGDTVENPKKVYLMLGINDLNQDKTIEQIKENYKKIINILIEKNKEVKIVIHSVLPIDKHKRKNRKVTNKLIDELNNKLETMCSEHKLKYVDLNSHFKDEFGYLDKKYSYDGLHLNGQGYQKWYELIKLVS